MARLSEQEKRDRKIAREIAANVRSNESLAARQARRCDYDKTYYAENKDEIKAKRRARYDATRERVYRSKNRDAINAAKRLAYDPAKERAARNTPEAKLYGKQWREQNRERLREYEKSAARRKHSREVSVRWYAANRKRINEERRAKRAAKRAEREALRKPAKKIRAAIMPPNRV